MLYNDGAGRIHQVAQDIQGIIHVGDIGLAWMFAGLEQLDIGRQVPARLNTAHRAQ